jgi:hypothetical protein
MEEAERQAPHRCRWLEMCTGEAERAQPASAKACLLSKKGQTCLGDRVEAQRVAAPELHTIVSLARGRQRRQGPRTIADRGPQRAGTTVADVWADLRPLRCMYSDMPAGACRDAGLMAVMLSVSPAIMAGCSPTSVSPILSQMAADASTIKKAKSEEHQRMALRRTSRSGGFRVVRAKQNTCTIHTSTHYARTHGCGSKESSQARDSCHEHDAFGTQSALDPSGPRVSRHPDAVAEVGWLGICPMSTM